MPFENQNAPNPGNLSLEGLSAELLEKVSEALAYPVIALCPDGQQLGVPTGIGSVSFIDEIHAKTDPS